MSLDSSTLAKMLKPIPSLESPLTSPELGRRRRHSGKYGDPLASDAGFLSEPESKTMPSRFRASAFGGPQYLQGGPPVPPARGGSPGQVPPIRGPPLGFKRDLFSMERGYSSESRDSRDSRDGMGRGSGSPKFPPPPTKRELFQLNT
ncbi:unnamed protein product, partial [Cyprideis torosa]